MRRRGRTLLLLSADRVRGTAPPRPARIVGILNSKPGPPPSRLVSSAARGARRCGSAGSCAGATRCAPDTALCSCWAGLRCVAAAVRAMWRGSLGEAAAKRGGVTGRCRDGLYGFADGARSEL